MERLKRKVDDNYFEAIKERLTGRGKNAIVFHGDGTSSSCGPAKAFGFGVFFLWGNTGSP
jgi:hypothetical protein